MGASKRFWNIFDKFITGLMVFGVVLIILDTFAVTVDVLGRYLFRVTHAELFEIVEYTLLWMTFLGAAWLLKNDGHVRIELVVSRLKPGHRTIMRTISSILVVVLLALVTFYSAKVTLQDFQTQYTLAGVLRPLKWPIEIIIPVGFFLLLVQSLRSTYMHFMDWRRTTREQSMPSNITPGGRI